MGNVPAVVELQGIDLIKIKVLEIKGVGLLLQEVILKRGSAKLFQARGDGIRAIYVGQLRYGERTA